MQKYEERIENVTIHSKLSLASYRSSNTNNTLINEIIVNLSFPNDSFKTRYPGTCKYMNITRKD